MTDPTYFYDPREGHGLPHDPFKAILAPRPIGWITSLDAEGRVNLAPYSFFNGFNSNPPVVGFSAERRPGGGDPRKDSLRNVEETGEFVCNFVSRELAEAMNETCAPMPHGEDEMRRAGLEAAPSTRVRPPRVARAPAALECKLLQIVALTDLEGRPLGSRIVLGQVVGVHIRHEFLKEGIFDTAAARPVARCGYRGDYAEVTSLFEMLRPVA
ncbi:flavin reductase family protein [Roseomonas sp. M0104]|uniref:Flavin reductase family protein n=1 Tax=Teichococcus coralli TaxID=2545983 RepID=A0A845BGL7_9PROT|nr:flavin reductase family protein [Pseudoroseomonas coralli]MXP64487.1 flavin reductase family protein [Pseudoroseomonas coralli]